MSVNNQITLKIVVADQESEEIAHKLSKTTGFVCVEKVPPESYLIVRKKCVYYQHYGSKFAPITFDLCSLIDQKDSRIFRNKSDILYKAVGFKKGCHSIVDCTAGMGWDALSLWHMGNANGKKLKLYAVERNPVVYSLLFGAVMILKDRSEMWHDLQVCYSEGLTFLKNWEEESGPDVIFLDPMFPERKKKALPRKEIQVFRQLGGNDVDSKQVLQQALQLAHKRVVVKRPLKGVELMTGVHVSLHGKLIRYDIYIISQK